MTDRLSPSTIQNSLKAPDAGGHSSGAIYKAITSAIHRLNCSGTAIDFGAGAGNMARILCENDSFKRVIAVDRSAGSYNHERLVWVPADLNLPLLVEDDAADSLLAVEVIEHLENAWSTAREWYRILKPGGRLIMSTPNNESWTGIMHLIFKRHFHLFLEPWYPAHITALVKMDVSRILARAGFENIEFFYTDEGMLPKWVSLTWQDISCGMLTGQRFSDNLICTAEKPQVAGTSQ